MNSASDYLSGLDNRRVLRVTDLQFNQEIVVAGDSAPELQFHALEGVEVVYRDILNRVMCRCHAEDVRGAYVEEGCGRAFVKVIC